MLQSLVLLLLLLLCWFLLLVLIVVLLLQLLLPLHVMLVVFVFFFVIHHADASSTDIDPHASGRSPKQQLRREPVFRYCSPAKTPRATRFPYCPPGGGSDIFLPKKLRGLRGSSIPPPKAVLVLSSRKSSGGKLLCMVLSAVRGAARSLHPSTGTTVGNSAVHRLLAVTCIRKVSRQRSAPPDESEHEAAPRVVGLPSDEVPARWRNTVRHTA